MKRFVLAAVLAFALAFGVRALVRALASDETKIRWQLASMAEGFDETRMNPVLAGLAPDFLDETHGADRELVRAALAHLFFQKKDPVTKGFLYRVEMPPESIVVAGDPTTGTTADVELVARLIEKRGEEEKAVWETRIEAVFVELDGEWRIRRAQHQSISGRLPR